MAAAPASSAAPTSAPEAHPDRLKADLVLLFASLGWGSTFALNKFALSLCSPNLYLALRFGVGTLAAALLARRSLKDLPSLKAGFLLGLCLWLGFILNTWGLKYTTATRSGFITGLAVVLVPLLGFLFFRQRVTLYAWLGAGLAGIGLTVLAAPALTSGAPRLARGDGWGDAITVASAVAYAFHLLLTGRFATRVVPFAAVTAQLAVVAVLSALSIPFEDVQFTPTPALLATVLFTGILCSAVFLFLQLWAQARTSAVRAAILFSLEPIFAALFAYLLLGDTLTPEVLQGGALILGGILLVEIWPRLIRPHHPVPAQPEG
ncbi:MAG TPA: DMT family transporter [Myxococcales bacterium]|jgi:drug/metabolite transporter (DMT)-like permease